MVQSEVSSFDNFKSALSISLLLLLCLLFFNLKAQTGLDPQKKLSQYILQKWDTNEGLSSESTNDLIQTPDGYIWIATYTGLHRFDGNNFTIFSTSNSNIPSSNVLKMSLDSKATLWIGSLHGLAYYQDGKFITPEALLPAKDHSIENMLITKNDEIWFSSKSNFVFRYSKDKLEDMTSYFQKSSTVIGMGEGSNGEVYLGTSDSHLYRFTESKGFEELYFQEKINGVNSIFVDNDKVYIGTPNGLFLLNGDNLEKLPFLQNSTITTISKDKLGDLWFGTFLGLYRYQKKSNKLDSLTESSGLPNNIIRTILFDEDGNLWGGTYRSGIFYLSDGIITTYSQQSGLNTDIISGIAEIGKNKFLFGNENGILNLLEDGNIKKFVPPIQLPSDRLKHMMSDNLGRIWVATYGGLYVLNGTKSEKFTIDNGFPDNFIRMTFQDKNGTIWVGTKNAGLIKFNSVDDWRIIDDTNGLTSNYIMSIEENEKGQLIVGTISGINILEADSVVKTITVEDGLPSNFSFSTCSLDPYLWIASNDGLIRYSEDTIIVFNRSKGMPSDIIYDVLYDQDGNLWLPSEKSILKISLAALNSAAEKSVEVVDYTVFDKSQGMLNNHCLGAVLSVVDSKGNFWIPTQGGVVEVSPKINMIAPENISSIIEKVVVDNIAIDLSKLIVPAGSDRLTIYYTGISYKYTQKLKFRYRLIPYDKDWVYNGSSRVASYTNIPPGNYEFQLETGIGDQYYDSSVSKNIKIEASWWQTIWAKILAVVGAITIGFLFYAYRVRALTVTNNRLANMVKERTSELEYQKHELSLALKNLSEAQEQMVQSEKMASLGVLSAGVAHEINNPLNFIQGGITALETLEFKDHPESDQIEHLISIVKLGIKRTSDIVSSLNEFSHHQNSEQSPCDIHHIIENCIVMLQYQLKDKIAIERKFISPPPFITGSNGEFHQVFLNILTNSIHAIHDRGNILVSTSVKGKNLVISVKDDGQGMSEATIKKITEPFYTTKSPGKGTGLGLSIVYNIVKKYNGELEFNSEMGVGTTSKVIFPLPEN
jgi:signal transduction histidine kinase/ligand-binding sensor domain-containing protein